MSTCKRSHKSIANCRHSQDEAKSKMSVSMDVMSCADNTGDKDLATMTVKGISVRLDRILVTGSDVMRGCSVKEGSQCSGRR